MNLIPWHKKTEIATTEDSDIVIHEGRPLTSRPRDTSVQVRSKDLKIAGKIYTVDPRELIRMIKNVTQTIGEYKSKDNPYAGYIVNLCAKARQDMANDLEHHFKIHWEIDEPSGKSIFYI